MKLSALAILVTAVAAAALPAEKPSKETSASPLTIKRATQGPGPCLSDVSCQGGTCKDRVCVYEPASKREVQDISKDPTCHNDVDCEGGSCLSGICTADPPAKRDYTPCDAGRQCDKGSSCQFGRCILNGFGGIGR